MNSQVKAKDLGKCGQIFQGEEIVAELQANSFGLRWDSQSNECTSGCYLQRGSMNYEFNYRQIAEILSELEEESPFFRLANQDPCYEKRQSGIFKETHPVIQLKLIVSKLRMELEKSMIQKEDQSALKEEQGSSQEKTSFFIMMETKLARVMTDLGIEQQEQQTRVNKIVWKQILTKIFDKERPEFQQLLLRDCPAKLGLLTKSLLKDVLKQIHCSFEQMTQKNQRKLHILQKLTSILKQNLSDEIETAEKEEKKNLQVKGKAVEESDSSYYELYSDTMETLENLKAKIGETSFSDFSFDQIQSKGEISKDTTWIEKKASSLSDALELRLCDEFYSERGQDETSSLSEEEEENYSAEKSLENFERDIWEYSLQCTREYQEVWQEFLPLYQYLCNIAMYLNKRVEMVGSFATGLWTHHSDINLAFVDPNDAKFQIRTVLNQIYTSLKNEKQVLKLKCLFLNDRLSVPNIKLEIENERGQKRRVCICMMSSANPSIKYARYVIRRIQKNPFTPVIFFTFHKLLQIVNLHKPTKKGLKTYTIFIMIEKSLELYPATNLLQAFCNFICYFAEIYEFQEFVAVEEGRLVEKARLNIIDPLNSNANIGGKDVDVFKLIELFTTVHLSIKMGQFSEVKDLFNYIFEIQQILGE